MELPNKNFILLGIVGAAVLLALLILLIVMKSRKNKTSSATDVDESNFTI